LQIDEVRLQIEERGFQIVFAFNLQSDFINLQSLFTEVVVAFVNLTLLLGGLGLMAVPVVLHLIMKQQPKQYVFPALRFVKQRKETNTRKLQLRHWILLALRCLAILLLGAALARPSVASTQFGNWLLVGGLGVLVALAGMVTLATALQKRGAALLSSFGAITALLGIVFLWLLSTVATGAKTPDLGDSKAPVAAVLLVDTAPRMQYKAENKTRLAAAQETAAWLLKQLPDESEIAVLDTRAGIASFAVDRAAATQTLERLQATGATLPIPTQLREAIRLVQQSEKQRKDIYIFTDLTAAAWDEKAASGLKEALAEAPGVNVTLIDVGVEKPQDYSLGDVRLSSETLPQSSTLEIQTEIRRLGAAGDRVVELLVEEPDLTRPILVNGKPLLPEAKVRHRQTIHLDDNASQAITFSVGKLPLGVHQGQVRIVGEDALAADDVRYFTVSVQPAWKTLVVAPRGTNTTFWTEAIAPYEFRETGQARFECIVVPQSDLSNQSLRDYAAVFLIDPGPLTPVQWEQLTEFATAGGGVGIFLGHDADPTSFNTKEAQALLPGKLNLAARVPEGTWLDPRSLEHPILAPFRTIGTSVPWRSFPVYRYWLLKEMPAGASTIVPFADGRPAIVQRQVGRGRVLLMTTPVSDPLSPKGRQAWNELPTGENAWPYFILANEMAGQLVSSGETRLNYLAGDTAILANDESQPQRYQLFAPTDDPYEVPARDQRLTIKFTDIPGAYRLKGELSGPVIRGFSVNLSPEATELARLERDKLDDLLGKDRYQLARTEEEITLESEARAGREFFSWLMVGLAVILGMEHVLANRFYKPEREESRVAER
jgi:hypothetical protein